MNVTAPALDSRIAEFAAAVRAELSDLPAEDVDDLVDGLDADLAEQASESDDFELPDPVAYAAELRSAAGLPERTTDASTSRRSPRERLNALYARIARALHSSKAATWVIELFVSLRPVWWIARGWALFVLLALPLGTWDTIIGFPGRNTGGWLLLGALMLLSIEWGRGQWVPGRALHVLRTAASVVAAVTLLFAIPATVTSAQNAVGAAYYSWTTVDEPTPGLAVDGTRVRNIFVYDAAGNPIEQVQLFDQDGRPLTTVSGQDASTWQWDEYFAYGGGPVPVPLVINGRSPVWNVYPLRELPFDAIEPDQAAAILPAAPFPDVPAVDGLTNPVPTATPSPGAATDAVPDPTPTPTPEGATAPIANDTVGAER
ncbi:hypothetical protein [Microbacterium sp. LWH3-1.2]|uniref:hypothetical protein n=1 Tax=Microbacterium sp. LWH3-1.2 TaxID=3135256 RepID=UPI0034298C90